MIGIFNLSIFFFNVLVRFLWEHEYAIRFSKLLQMPTIRYFKNRKLHLDCKSSISDQDMYGNLKTNCFFINFRSFELKKEINFSKA